MPSEDFEFMLGQFGSLDKAQPTDLEMLAAYRGKLPASLLDFWAECGIGMWFKSRFQFCDPRRYKPIVDAALEGDPQFVAARTHAYGYTAFGDLWLWNEDYQALELKLPYLWASSLATNPNWSPSNPDIAIVAPLVGLDRQSKGDFYEDTDDASPMFKKALKKLGQLELGEVYGFVPALELGGSAHLENLHRVSALEHFAILAQLGPVQLFDYSTGDQQFVRMLGAQ